MKRLRVRKREWESGSRESGKTLLGNYSLLIALASGILMGLTVAPVGAWYLAWVALAPLWVLVVKSPDSRFPIPDSLLWGIGYHGVALFWITGIHPMTWMGVPWLSSLAIALFCWIFITLWGAALVAAWSIGMRAVFGFRLPLPPTPLFKGGL